MADYFVSVESTSKVAARLNEAKRMRGEAGYIAEIKKILEERRAAQAYRAAMKKRFEIPPRILSGTPIGKSASTGETLVKTNRGVASTVNQTSGALVGRISVAYGKGANYTDGRAGWGR